MIIASRYQNSDSYAFVFRRKVIISDWQELQFSFFFTGTIEIFASHSTPSFIYGWKLSGKSVEIDISRLDKEKFKSFETCLRIKSQQFILQGQSTSMQQVDRQLEALEKHKKLIREHREKEEKLRERIFTIIITGF